MAGRVGGKEGGKVGGEEGGEVVVATVGESGNGQRGLNRGHRGGTELVRVDSSCRTCFGSGPGLIATQLGI